MDKARRRVFKKLAAMQRAKADALQAKLARSMGGVRAREVKDPKSARNTKGFIIGPERIPAPIADPSALRCKKISISLFAADMERIGTIRGYMAQRGTMINASQAVKLALRVATIDGGLLKALEAVKLEDGRG